MGKKTQVEARVKLLGFHEMEGEWLDACKKLKVKDENKRVIGNIVDLIPESDGLLVIMNVDKSFIDKTLEFYNSAKNPHFRML